MVPAFFKTNGQSGGRFRRTQPEKRIHNQYIGRAQDNVDPDVEAARLSRDLAAIVQTATPTGER
jgi:hypothetical protein